MRLTLRTLLAYLDDTLEPAAAKEIGQKLTESPVAQDLVSRIKEVTRRRRVTAPSLIGDDVDPNVLAEYLDNLLPPDAVAELETHCLESDVHLAEAAACHQILTLIGQPAGVSDAMKQKMYDLVHAIESIPAERRPMPSSRVAAPPSVFAQRPQLARILTAAAILLGAVGIAWLVWVSLPPKDTGLSGDNNALARNDSDKGPPGHFIPNRRALEEEEPPDAALDSQPPASDIRVPPTSEEELPGTRPDRSDAIDPLATEMPETKPPANETETTTADAAKPGDSASETTTEPPKEASVPPAPNPPAEKPLAVLGNYASTSGVMLRTDESGRDWKRVNSRSDIHESERVLCLPWYRAAIQAPTGATVEMVGETELLLLPPDEGVDVHMQLDRGRIVLATNQEGATFQIDFLNQSWRLTTKAPEVVVGLMLSPIWRAGGPFSFEATIFVPRGEVDFQTAGETEALGGPVQMRWSSIGTARAKEALNAAPAWMEREELTASEIRAAALLEDDLRHNPRTERPVALALVDATNSDRKESRFLGVLSLAAIGRLPALIDAMNTNGRRELRQAAIAALRRHIARGPAYEDALRQALFVKFSKSQEHAQGVIDLLRGYSDAEFLQLQKKDYEDLVKLLSPDRELLIRELAIINLEDLAGKPLNTNYNPDKPKDSDIAAWQRALSDNRLPPRVRGKM
jgi:hypothetical protein